MKKRKKRINRMTQSRSLQVRKMTRTNMSQVRSKFMTTRPQDQVSLVNFRTRRDLENFRALKTLDRLLWLRRQKEYLL